MKFAKKLSEHMPKEGLKLHIHRLLAGWDKPRPVTHIHASDLTKMDKNTEYCPREFALLQLTGYKAKDRFIGTSLQYTFDMGRLLEHQMQNVYAKDIAIGEWLCFHCSKKTSFGSHPGTCTVCNRKDWNYIEPRFMSQYCGASGGIDLLVKLKGEKKLRLVEVKSIDKDMYKQLVAPLAEHTLRTNLYLRLVEESNSPFKDMVNTKEGMVFYMCKGFGTQDNSLTDFAVTDAGFSPFKEFFVGRNDSDTDALVELSRQLFAWRNKAAGVPPPICSHGMCPRAKKCKVAKVCWSGEYPPGAKIYLEDKNESTGA